MVTFLIIFNSIKFWHLSNPQTNQVNVNVEKIANVAAAATVKREIRKIAAAPRKMEIVNAA